MMGFFLLIVIGLFAGWMANLFTQDGGLGKVGNIIGGIVGSLLGGLLFQQFGARLTGWNEAPALLASFGVGLVVAVVLLVIACAIKK